MPRLRLAALALLAFALPLCAQTDKADAKPWESDPKFVEAMKQAKELKHEQQYNFAAESYKKAIKISDGKCRRCLNDLYTLQMGMGSFKDATATALQLEAVADTPREKSNAESRAGEALLHAGGDKPKPAQLEAVHAMLQAALTDFPRNQQARWSDSCVLAKMGKTDEASQGFADCAKALKENDPQHARAVRFAAKPELALNKMAPPFQLTSLDGTHFNLDEQAQAGKVVLIEFWATWCPSCVAGIPTVKKIAKEFANDPLTIVSISCDEDDAKWRQFIAKNEMTWLQYRDANDSINQKFSVSLIPHYFTIDSDGTLTMETTDTDALEGRLKKLIKHAKETKPTAATAVISGTK